MKKDLFLFLAILLISQYYCDDEDDDSPCWKEDVPGKEVCTGREAGEGYYKCCFLKSEYEEDGKKGTYQGCWPVTKDQYDKIKDTIEELEKLDNEGDSKSSVSLDCSSNYIIISILPLILLFL